MPDITREEFLRGLRLSRDADNTVSLYGPDGDHVIYVVGNLGLDLSAYQIGSWVAAACHEYAARRREQTHSAECWRLPGHEACARGLLKRWWPVIEAAEARQRAWLSYQNAPGFSAERDRLRGEYMRAAERFDSAILKACAALAALEAEVARLRPLADALTEGRWLEAPDSRHETYRLWDAGVGVGNAKLVAEGKTLAELAAALRTAKGEDDA